MDPRAFKDEYELALRKLVKRKTSGKTIERQQPREARSNVIDLMSALRQSVGGKVKSAGGAKKVKTTKPPRRKAS